MRLFERYPSRPVCRAAVAAAAVAAVGVAMAAPTQASAPTYTVKNNNDSGTWSLRQAIDDANLNPNGPNLDRIEFDIPGVGGHIITLASDLPAITDPVKVLGYTQPGSVVGIPGTPATVKIIVD